MFVDFHCGRQDKHDIVCHATGVEGRIYITVLEREELKRGFEPLGTVAMFRHIFPIRKSNLLTSSSSSQLLDILPRGHPRPPLILEWWSSQTHHE